MTRGPGWRTPRYVADFARFPADVLETKSRLPVVVRLGEYQLIDGDDPEELDLGEVMTWLQECIATVPAGATPRISIHLEDLSEFGAVCKAVFRYETVEDDAAYAARMAKAAAQVERRRQDGEAERLEVERRERAQLAELKAKYEPEGGQK